MGVDGISVLFMILLTTAPDADLYSRQLGERSKSPRARIYGLAFLVLETLLIGMSSASGLRCVAVYMFSSRAMLIPMFLIIGIWGGAEPCLCQLTNSFCTRLAGSSTVPDSDVWLSGILRFNTMEIPVLMETVRHRLPLYIQKFLAVPRRIFASFAVKVPMWPFHTWLPDAHVRGAHRRFRHPCRSAFENSVLTAILRFSLPMLPQAMPRIISRRLIFWLSVIAVIYTSLVALMQDRHEKADRLFVGRPYGLCHAWLVSLSTPAGDGRRARAR